MKIVNHVQTKIDYYLNVIVNKVIMNQIKIKNAINVINYVKIVH